MIILKNKRKKTNNPNWSYGGTSILNAIETESYLRGKRKSVSAEYVTNYKKLLLLMRRFPTNSFYNSLYSKCRKYHSLSDKQSNCIKSDYQKHFGN
jgi:hypothetical protein